MRDLFDMTGKTAVVTGGGRGIGLMATTGLLLAGARVYIASRDVAACQVAAQGLKPFGDIVPLAHDLATTEGCRALADDIAAKESALHVLVNNSGAAWGASFPEYPENGWDKTMDLNVKAPFFLVQALLPLLQSGARSGDPSRVINIGSVDGLRVPRSNNFAYSASKAALHHLTKVLAVELGPRNLTVNAIAPGPFRSKMMAATLADSQDRLETASPLGRIGEDDDIAGAVVYLSSRAGAFVTGAVLPVDGGISLVPGV
jgi:NAD(P)-dependent dehydrogenase (short-subunit alcohol dehydrogenase family)